MLILGDIFFKVELPFKTITVPLLLQVANSRLTGNDSRKIQSHMVQNHGVWLRPLNVGPSYTWKKASSREHWHSVVITTTLWKSIPLRERANTSKVLEGTQATDPSPGKSPLSSFCVQKVLTHEWRDTVLPLLCDLWCY